MTEQQKYLKLKMPKMCPAAEAGIDINEYLQEIVDAKAGRTCMDTFYHGIRRQKMGEKIVQTAGRDALGEFAPEFVGEEYEKDSKYLRR